MKPSSKTVAFKQTHESVRNNNISNCQNLNELKGLDNVTEGYGQFVEIRREVSNQCSSSSTLSVSPQSSDDKIGDGEDGDSHGLMCIVTTSSIDPNSLPMEKLDITAAN